MCLDACICHEARSQQARFADSTKLLQPGEMSIGSISTGMWPQAAILDDGFNTCTTDYCKHTRGRSKRGLRRLSRRTHVLRPLDLAKGHSIGEP